MIKEEGLGGGGRRKASECEPVNKLLGNIPS